LNNNILSGYLIKEKFGWAEKNYLIMKYDKFLMLVFGMLMLTATCLASEFNVHLKVLDSNDKPFSKFEVLTYNHNQDFTFPWRKGNNGDILLNSRDYPGQVIIRAAGFAPAIIEMGRLEPNFKRTVKLNKGQNIEMVLTAKNGREIPDSLIPWVVFPDFQDRALLSFQHKGKHDFDYNFTSLVKIKAGHYIFNIADDSPQIYVFIDQPGFIRAFRAGPFSKKDLANGKLEIELPKPVELEVVFGPPKDWAGDLPYAKCWLEVMRKHPEDEKRLSRVVFIKSENPRLYMPIEFFAPGNYWIELNTEPSDNSEAFVEGKANPAFYRDMKEFSLTAGQTEKVVFQYTTYDENCYKGNCSINMNIRWHNGKPAAGVPYTIFYEDRHFGSIIIEESKIPDDGQIKLTGLAGGDNAHFTLEIEKGELGRYLFQLLSEEKNRELEYKIGPLKGDMAPDIAFVDIFTGQKGKLSDFKDKVIFIEFWATWCGPCQEPTAHLCQIASDRKTDWDSKAVLLCVSIDDKKEDVIRYVRSRGWLGVHHLWCEEGEPGFKSVGAKTYGIIGVPTALLIDQSGRIVWRGHPESFDIEANIDKHFKDRQDR
jgi:hypothetical protein